MFLLIGAFFIISQNNLALKETGNLNKFISLYSAWLTRILDNSSNAVGYVIKMDWLPGQNSTKG